MKDMEEIWGGEAAVTLIQICGSSLETEWEQAMASHISAQFRRENVTQARGCLLSEDSQGS